MGMEGKIALVTGGGRGIGKATALALAAAGADVALLARSEAQLSETADEVRRLGRRCLMVPGDVTNREAVDAAVARVNDELGQVQILVNNAGVAPSLKFQDTTDEIWLSTMDVNLNGAFYFCRAVLPGMRQAGWGRIINVASTAAKIGYAFSAAYVASKHGLLGLTRALALEAVRWGITINAVCPGFVDTNIVAVGAQNISDKTGRSIDEAKRALASTSPQARLMTAEEIAAAIVYLAGDAAAGINGQGLVIDGGGVQS